MFADPSMARKSLIRKSEQSEVLTTPKTPFKKTSHKDYSITFTPFSLSTQPTKKEKLISMELKGTSMPKGAYEILPNLKTRLITEDDYLREYEIITKCGEGSFMTAYRVRRDNAETCLKVSKRPYKGRIDRENKLKEVEILYKLRSPFVTKIIKAWEQDSLLYIELEYCDPTLSKMINEKYFNEKSEFTRKLIYRLICEIGLGLLSLHHIGYVHNDVKPENIFYNANFKIGDFNISQEEGHIEEDGDKKYMPPEILRGECTMKSDVYSLGLIFAELLCNVVLPTSSTAWENLRQNNFDDLPTPKQHRCFLFKMLHESPVLRPSMSEVVDYFQRHLRAK